MIRRSTENNVGDSRKIISGGVALDPCLSPLDVIGRLAEGASQNIYVGL